MIVIELDPFVLFLSLHLNIWIPSKNFHVLGIFVDVFGSPESVILLICYLNRLLYLRFFYNLNLLVIVIFWSLNIRHWYLVKFVLRQRLLLYWWFWIIVIDICFLIIYFWVLFFLNLFLLLCVWVIFIKRTHLFIVNLIYICVLIVSHWFHSFQNLRIFIYICV